MEPTPPTTRRGFLGAAAAAGLAGRLAPAAEPAPRRPVAAVVTAYERGLHADVLLGKILDGWEQAGGPGPALELKAMYVDQFSPRDMARAQSRKHGVPIVPTIEEALTLGGGRIAVDGVISIGEHGDYPHNAKGQHLYPRRRFFEGITAAFEKHGRVVPVFSDKHIGPEWADALWMYGRAKALKVPFMAGSSMPLGFRVPDVSLPLGAPVTGVVGVGYSGLDIYGFHALEFLQAQAERRRGAERGVRRVQGLRGAAAWEAADARLPGRAVEAALAAVPRTSGADPRRDRDAALFLFEYVDGLTGGVLMLPQSVQGTAVALTVEGRADPIATRFDERTEPRHPHFAYLLKAIERMVHTGRPSYPVERTLLTAGILDRALTSLAEGERALETPELAIRYETADYPHAPRPPLDADPRS